MPSFPLPQERENTLTAHHLQQDPPYTGISGWRISAISATTATPTSAGPARAGECAEDSASDDQHWLSRRHRRQQSQTASHSSTAVPSSSHLNSPLCIPSGISIAAPADTRQEVERRPEDAADDIRHHKLRDGQIQHPGHHRHQRTRWANEAPHEDGEHAVLVQRMLGFIQQRFVFFMNDQVQRLLKAPAQPEGDPVPSKQPIIPAIHACQKLTSPLPISAPSPAIITVPGRISPTSASDSRNATSATAMSEYITDWVIKCSSNACITIPVRKRISDSA